MKKIPFLPPCLSPCPAPSLRRSDESGSDKGGGSWVERDEIRNVCWQLYFCNKCESNNTNTDRKGISLFYFLSNQIKHDPMLSVHLIRIKIKLKQNPASSVKPLLPTLGSCRPPASLARFCGLCRLDAPHLCPLLSDLPTGRVSSVPLFLHLFHTTTSEKVLKCPCSTTLLRPWGEAFLYFWKCFHGTETFRIYIFLSVL